MQSLQQVTQPLRPGGDPHEPPPASAARAQKHVQGEDRFSKVAQERPVEPEDGGDPSPATGLRPVVDQEDATALVAPGFHARVDAALNIILERR